LLVLWAFLVSTPQKEGYDKCCGGKWFFYSPLIHACCYI
jgi:hypothetical protein